MRGVVFRFDSFPGLAETLHSEQADRTIALPCCRGLRDGEWLLATFEVGNESTAIAGQIVDHGDSMRLSFEDRDWDELWEFAHAGGPPSMFPASPQSVSDSVMPPPGSQVLVVDDDPGVQCVVLAVLKAGGYQAEACGSAEEALDRLRQGSVDLLILDRNLDGMSGLELCRRLRRDNRYCSVPILFLSSLSSATELDEAFEAGADDFVSKPFRAHELGARVLSLLCRAKAVRAEIAATQS